MQIAAQFDVISLPDADIVSSPCSECASGLLNSAVHQD
jgi:hypothetical protein